MIQAPLARAATATAEIASVSTAHKDRRTTRLNGPSSIVAPTRVTVAVSLGACCIAAEELSSWARVESVPPNRPLLVAFALVSCVLWYLSEWTMKRLARIETERSLTPSEAVQRLRARGGRYLFLGLALLFVLVAILG